MLLDGAHADSECACDVGVAHPTRHVADDLPLARAHHIVDETGCLLVDVAHRFHSIPPAGASRSHHWIPLPYAGAGEHAACRWKLTVCARFPCSTPDHSDTRATLR